MSFIPYPPGIYNIDYDRVKELNNRLYSQRKEFSNPILLDEQMDQENFANIMCNNYTDDQIVSFNNSLLVKVLKISVSN